MKSVDLNCDMGEGCGNDAELMRYVSSANIACGFHAGDAAAMRRTAELALGHGVAIGAHPGYRDRDNFGRKPMDLSASKVFDIVAEQISALSEICRSLGTSPAHIKPHGALYNQAARDRQLAAAIASAVKSADASLVLYGLSGSFLISEAEKRGLRTASEVFADRTYRSDGSLTPRTRPNALIEDRDAAIGQVLQMANAASVISTEGVVVPLRADTICIHGDGPHAVEFAKSVREALIENGIEIRSGRST